MTYLVIGVVILCSLLIWLHQHLIYRRVERTVASREAEMRITAIAVKKALGINDSAGLITIQEQIAERVRRALLVADERKSEAMAELHRVAGEQGAQIVELTDQVRLLIAQLAKKK